MTNLNRSAVASATLVAFSLLVPCVAKAQRMAPASGPRPTAPVAHSRPVVPRVVSTRASAGTRTAAPARNGVQFNSAINSFVAADGSSVSLQDLLNPVPSFGFDYHHLSVIDQDLGIKAVIDPVTEWKLAVAQRFLQGSGFGGPGYFLLDGGGAYAIPEGDSTPADQPAPQPQVIVVQAPPSHQADAEPPSAEPSVGESTEPTDVGQFILVLQNGSQIQAVAFTRMKDRIVYITTDGSRRTLAVADLNSDATVRVNEERGTPLQLPL